MEAPWAPPPPIYPPLTRVDVPRPPFGFPWAPLGPPLCPPRTPKDLPVPAVWLTTGINGFQEDLTRPKEAPEHPRGARMSPRKRLMVAECTEIQGFLKHWFSD